VCVFVCTLFLLLFVSLHVLLHKKNRLDEQLKGFFIHYLIAT